MDVSLNSGLKISITIGREINKNHRYFIWWKSGTGVI